MDGIDLSRMAADEDRLRFPALPDDDGDDEPADAGPATRVYKDVAELLSIPDIEYRDVWVPEWDSHVRVRGLSQLERDQIIDSCRVGKGRKERFVAKGMEAKFVIAAAVNPDGSRKFGPEHLYPLMQKSAGAVHRIYVVVEQMCGFDADADAEDDPLAATRGKSSTTPNGASPFASRGT
jgi:hypothetical protein